MPAGSPGPYGPGVPETAAGAAPGLPPVPTATSGVPAGAGMPFGQPGTPAAPAPGGAAPGIMIGLPGDPQTTNWPYGSMPVPPAPRRRRRWPWVAGAIALVLVLGAVAVPLYQRLTRPTPTEQVQSALAALEHAPAIRLTGESITAEGAGQRFDLAVGAKRGYGRIRDAAGSADVLVDGDTTYLRGDRSWLLGEGPDTELYQTGHWVSDSSALSVAPAELTPKALARYLGKGLRANADRDAHAEPADAAYPHSVGGTAVSPYRLPAGAVAFVTARSPYRLVAVDRAPGAPDGGYVDLQVAPVAGTTFDRGIDKLKSTLADRDPKAPAHYSVVAGSEKQGTCDQYSCTESMQIKADGGTTGRKGHLVVFFSADKAGRHVVSTCQARLPSVRPNHQARVSCTTDSAAWQRWAGVRSRTYWYWFLPLDPGYVGDHPSRAVHLFTGGGIDEQDADSAVLTSETAMQLADHLVAVDDWSRQDAIDAVDSIAEAGALGALAPLVLDNRVTLDEKTFGSWFDAAHLDLAVAAHQRAAAGSTKLALGTWRDSDGKAFEADLIDRSKKVAVTAVALTRTGVSSAIRDAARKANDSAVPAGYGRELRVEANPRSALYWVSPHDAAAALRTAGVTPAMLHGIRRVQVVTGFGTATLTPNQLSK
jgi:hypothetical protein